MSLLEMAENGGPLEWRAAFGSNRDQYPDTGFLDPENDLVVLVICSLKNP